MPAEDPETAARSVRELLISRKPAAIPDGVENDGGRRQPGRTKTTTTTRTTTTSTMLPAAKEHRLQVPLRRSGRGGEATDAKGTTAGPAGTTGFAEGTEPPKRLQYAAAPAMPNPTDLVLSKWLPMPYLSIHYISTTT